MEEKGKEATEQILFPKEEYDSLIKWKPVSNIPTEEIYKDLPEVKEYHDMYKKLWLKER